MRSKAMQKWMSHEMERLSMRFERYKPSGSGYNRIQSVLLSRSVTHMLNNPLPVEDQIGSAYTMPTTTTLYRSRGVLSRSESEWEEVYPTVKFSRSNSRESEVDEKTKSFAYYRNCSTRVT